MDYNIGIRLDVIMEKLDYLVKEVEKAKETKKDAK